MSTDSTVPPPRRRYDGSGRQRDAAERQGRILTAARDLFLRDGYGATSIEHIAREAATSPQTIYAAFGSKAGVLRRVIDVAIGGDDQQISLIERPESRALLAESDIRRRLRLAVEFGAQTHARSGELIALVHRVAGSDAAVGDLANDLDAQVRIDTERIIRGTGGIQLRRGLSMTHAVDVVALMGGPMAWHRLVIERGWSPDEYVDWLVDALEHVLLEPS